MACDEQVASENMPTTGLREDGIRSDSLDMMASTKMNDKDLLECKKFEVWSAVQQAGADWFVPYV